MPPPAKGFEAINDHTFDVDGGMRVDVANEEMGLALPEHDDYETVAGFILHVFDRVPKPNEEVRYRNLRLAVTEMRGAKIERILLVKDNEEVRS